MQQLFSPLHVRPTSQRLWVTARYLAGALILGSLLFAAGCSVSAITEQARNPDVPEQWQQDINAKPFQADESEQPDQSQQRQSGMAEWDSTQLASLVKQALDNNYLIARQAAQLEESRQNVISSGAERWPDLSLGLDASRRATQMQARDSVINTGSTDNNFTLGLELSWEIDLWGKLSDSQRQAQLSFAAQQAAFADAQLQLIADTASAWFNVVSERQQLELFQQRLKTLQQDAEIIESGYRRGINNALDLYLSRSTLAQEQARVAQQQQDLTETISALQLLLAVYPDGTYTGDILRELPKQLPVIHQTVPFGMPSELISRRPGLQRAWYQLLSADAALAVAHKQRFPRLSLTASVSDNSSELDQLLDGGKPAWSLLGNLSQPLFNAGRLKALEEQARARVVQAEQSYLDQLYKAFAEVENTLSNLARLDQRYQAFLQAERDANAALELSFDQYQRGLIAYATVLESQRRAFDAQTTVIQLRNQLLQSRIALYLALGGDFTDGVNSDRSIERTTQ